MESFKRIMAAGIAAATVFSLSACGSSSTSSQAGDADHAKITVWGWEPTLKQATEAFQKKYPNIEVKLEHVGKSTDTQKALTNALNAGSGAPDVVLMEQHTVSQYALSDALEDITDKASGYDGFFLDGIWRNSQVGGKIYGMPLAAGPVAFFYNKEVFDKAGVSEPPATWDEYYEAAKKIRAVGSYIDTAFGGPQMDSLLWQADAQPVKLDGDNVTINYANNPKAKKVLDFWQKLIDEDLIATNIRDWTEDWNRGLGDGTIASLTIGSWMPANFLTLAAPAKGKWRVATIPQWKEGDNYNSECGGSVLSIVKGTKNREAAWKYVDFVTHDPEGIKVRVNAGSSPADKDTVTSDSFLKGSDEITEYFGGQEYGKVLSEAALQDYPDWQYPPFGGYAQSIYPDYVGKAYQKTETLQEALSAYQDDLVNFGNQQGFTVNK